MASKSQALKKLKQQAREQAREKYKAPIDEAVALGYMERVYDENGEDIGVKLTEAGLKYVSERLGKDGDYVQ